MSDGRKLMGSIGKTPFPVLLLIAAFLCPTELSLYISGLRFPPHRVALFILFPFAITHLISQNGLRIRSFDIVFVLFGLWTVGIYMYHQGEQEGLAYGGSLALESLGGYLVARTWIRNEVELRSTLKAFGLAILVAALFALPETIFGQIYTHNYLRELTGYVHPIGLENRLGLTRAYGVFDHPIHHGTFCASLLAMFWYAEPRVRDRLKRIALICGATILAVSSAPMLGLGFQGAMLLWDKLTRRFKGRSAFTAAVIIGLFFGVTAISNRGPFALIATGLTLDPSTGYYRLLIWENGLENVWANPLTGIGLADWTRPAWMASSTVDAFWLVVAMRTGIPAFIMLVIAIAMLVRSVAKRGLKNNDVVIRDMARGWSMSLISFCLVATTVHLWNVPYAFFFFFLGTAGWIADPVRVKVRSKALRTAPAPQGGRRATTPPSAIPVYAHGPQAHAATATLRPASTNAF